MSLKGKLSSKLRNAILIVDPANYVGELLRLVIDLLKVIKNTIVMAILELHEYPKGTTR